MLSFKHEDFEYNLEDDLILDVNKSIPWVTNRAQDAVYLIASRLVYGVGPESIIHIIDTTDPLVIEGNMLRAIKYSEKSTKEYRELEKLVPHLSHKHGVR